MHTDMFFILSALRVFPRGHSINSLDDRMGATLTRTEFRAILRRPQTIAGVMVVQ